MSGHSKWSTIKRKKGANDAARGKVFAKISKEIMIAVREGGSADANANTRLRAAIIKGHSENMPNSNIERAIKKGLGDSDGERFDEITYEGYAPGGIAVMVYCLTDNKNRTGPEVRHVFSKYGGNLGENGCVSYMFQRRGIILVARNGMSEDQMFEVALEAGADDVGVENDFFEIITSPELFSEVTKVLEEHKHTIEHAEISMIPDTYIKIDDKGTEQSAMTLIEQMEELDDVQLVSHNLELAD